MILYPQYHFFILLGFYIITFKILHLEINNYENILIFLNSFEFKIIFSSLF
jgi:hypothetical protein